MKAFHTGSITSFRSLNKNSEKRIIIESDDEETVKTVDLEQQKMAEYAENNWKDIEIHAESLSPDYKRRGTDRKSPNLMSIQTMKMKNIIKNSVTIRAENESEVRPKGNFDGSRISRPENLGGINFTNTKTPYY